MTLLSIKRRKENTEKDLDTHQADSIGHQKLLLKEIHQLRNENDKMRNAADNSKNRDVMWHKRVWMLLALVVLGMAILGSYLHRGGDRVVYTTVLVFVYTVILAYYLHKEKNHTDENERSIQSIKQSIQSHDQYLRFLMSDAFSNSPYLHDYIQDRDRTLQGVEWTHRNVRGETYYGPIFYLGNCKLRLHVHVYLSVSDDRRDANYYVTRLKGDYDDVSDTCHITYIHLYSVNKRYFSRDNVERINESVKLKVGEKCYIPKYV